MGRIIDVTVDSADVAQKLRMMQDAMEREQFERAMYGIFKRVTPQVRRILKSDLPTEYNVKKGKIGSAVKNPQVSMGGGSVGCAIPIRAPRGKIGTDYPAAGGAHGWASLRRKYRVRAKILAGGRSELPEKADSYGGQPPFRNLSSSLNRMAFTRKGKSRGPVAVMSGIAIPQMPMNRSEAAVQGHIAQWLEVEIDRRLRALIMLGR